MMKVDVAKDFTRYPSGRYKKNGKTSGEEFREKFLEPHIKSGEAIVVLLDGTIGYGSSFLEEAFGGLVRSMGISGEKILHLLRLESVDKSLIQEIEEYINDASIKIK